MSGSALFAKVCRDDDLFPVASSSSTVDDVGRVTGYPTSQSLSEGGTSAGCRLPCKSLSSGTRTSPGALGRARKTTVLDSQLARVPLGNGSCLRRTGHPFAVSGPLGPSQKIEFVFAASPETIHLKAPQSTEWCENIPKRMS